MARIIGNHISLEMFVLWMLEFLLAFLVFYVLLLPGDAPELGFGMSGGPVSGLHVGTVKSAAMLGFTVGLTSVAIGLYRPEICLRTRHLLVNSVVAGVIGFPLILLVSLLTQIDPSLLLGTDALWPMKMLLSWVLLLFGTRLVMRIVLRLGLLTRNVLIIGTEAQAVGTTAAVAALPRQAFEIAGVIPPGAADTLSAAGLRRQRIWAVVIADPNHGQTALAPLLAARRGGVRVFSDIGFREQQLRRMDLASLTADWVLYADGINPGPVARFVRRAADIVLSLLGLALTLPVLALAALAIKLDGPGPILYRQERVGLQGGRFTLLKLRSMRQDAEADGPTWATLDDQRVTRVGAFLRKTRIDELPQLFNVLRGEMGFVGPRPERPHFVDQLAAAIPFYDDRHYVKPGITGWAQVSMPYGASIDDGRRKLAYDLYYVKHRSLFLDALIILSTVRVILFQEGAR